MRLKIDGSLDVVTVHEVGGIMGTPLTAVLGAEMFGGVGLGKVSLGEQEETEGLVLTDHGERSYHL